MNTSPTLKDVPLPPTGKTGWPWTEESPQFPDRMPDGSPWPRISIVTPSYNQGQFIEETIRSVLLQGYPNLEFIVMDGGSIDNSVEVIEKYKTWLTFWRSENDEGQTCAIKKGMERATGDLVNWLNSDDYLLPNALLNVAKTYTRYQSIEAVICGCGIYIDKNGKIRSHSKTVFVQEKFLPNAPPVSGGVQASWFISRTAWQKVGGINADYSYIMDIDLYFRCYEHAIPFFLLDQELAAYRTHESAKTQADWKTSILSKKKYYESKINSLDIVDREYYRRQLARHIAGLYYRTIFFSEDLLLQTLHKLVYAAWNESAFASYFFKRTLKKVLDKYESLLGKTQKIF